MPTFRNSVLGNTPHGDSDSALPTTTTLRFSSPAKHPSRGQRQCIVLDKACIDRLKTSTPYGDYDSIWLIAIAIANPIVQASLTGTATIQSQGTCCSRKQPLRGLRRVILEVPPFTTQRNYPLTGSSERLAPFSLSHHHGGGLFYAPKPTAPAWKPGLSLGVQKIFSKNGEIYLIRLLQPSYRESVRRNTETKQCMRGES